MSADQDGRGVPVPIVVTGCADCPMAVCVDNRAHCKHPDRTTKTVILVDPDWCPLRSNPAIVVLRTDVSQVRPTHPRR